MQKSIIFVMPLGIDFLLDFDGFLVPKWSQIGIKMGSKIDVNFERPILQKYLQNPCFFIDFLGFGSRSW